MSFVGKWKEVESIMLDERSQTQKVKYCMFSFMCEMWWGGDMEVER
jgi:hypothetical protein